MDILEREVTVLEKADGEPWSLEEKLQIRRSRENMEVWWLPIEFQNRIVLPGRKSEDRIIKALGHHNFTLSFVLKSERWKPLPIEEQTQ